jgi:hypothetical protein
LAPPQGTQIELLTSPLPWRAWLGALLFAVLLLVFLVWSDIAAVLYPRGDEWLKLVGDKADHSAHAAAQILSGNARRADVVLLGSSSAREAFWPDEQIEAHLASFGKSSISVANLASFSQSPLESHYLIDSIPPRAGQIYVWFDSFTALRRADRARRLLEADFLLPQVPWVKKKHSEGLLDARFVESSKLLRAQWRAKRRLLHRQVKYRLSRWIQEYLYGVPLKAREIYGFDDAPKGDRAAFEGYRRVLAEDLARGDHRENLKHLVQVMAASARLLERAGARLVIAAVPEHQQELRKMHPEPHAEFVRALSEVRERYGLGVLDLNHGIDWVPEDFVDPIHVSELGREKWSRRFVEWLAAQPMGGTETEAARAGGVALPNEASFAR